MNEDATGRVSAVRIAARLTKILLCLFLAQALPMAPAKAQADADEAMRRLTGGEHVLMVRHALAPGSGDPPGFRLGDCATQRNLDTSGRAQAREIGDWLKGHGLASAEVFSSQWCRCLETARLMDIGPVSELPALNSFYEQPENREANLQALREFLATRRGAVPPTVLVTHYVTIAAITGVGVSSGEGVLVELEGDGQYTVRARLDFEP